MIPFNKPALTGLELDFIKDAMSGGSISGDGKYSQKCSAWFEKKLKCKKALLTTSCTHALEMAALLIDIHPGDEVIMPSYTFVSTANAFVLRGAKIVFVDVRPDTMNIDESLIESAITTKTKAIVPVHYAGVSCAMDDIMRIAHKYNLYVIEDAAQGMMAEYDGKPLGTIGHFGTYSFHESKNYTSAGEGGLLIINDAKFVEKAEIIREKGTNRTQFFRGEVAKYSWVGIGSSYLLNDISAAYLWGQLQIADEINKKRLSVWNTYYQSLMALEEQSYLELPVVPEECRHNSHMFYVKVKDLGLRTRILEYLKSHEIWAVFHYIPLHDSIAGRQYSRFSGHDVFTTKESNRLFRLPIFYNIKEQEVNYILERMLQYGGYKALIN
jgi:dTDP-4-amino-4,6-dideoxygalactose transaminase